MDDQVSPQPAINETADINPVSLPDQSLSLSERVARLEDDLNLT